VDNYCTSVDAEKCVKLRASNILRIAYLTTVKVTTRTKVAPFYLGHGVVFAIFQFVVKLS